MQSIIKFLKFVNSIPFEFTMKHYQMFGDSQSMLKDNSLCSEQSWDVLRLNHPHFSIPETREAWLETSELKVKKDGQDNDLISRAQDVCSLISMENISSIFSVGVGGAGLEYQIKKIKPNIHLVCSEYSAKNVEILRKVFTECDEVVRFDILKGDWSSVQKKYLQKNGALIIYRLDASFTDGQWRSIFESIFASGIENIIYIPTAFLTILSVWNRKKREIKWLMGRKPVSFAGHIRSRKKFQSFWRFLYEEESMDFGGLHGFFLKRKGE